MILPYITKQVLYTPMADFKHLLEHKSIRFPDFVNPQLSQKATDLVLGCCVVILSDGAYCFGCFTHVGLWISYSFARISGEEPVKADASTIAISCWRGNNSLAVMITLADCQELLERLAERTPKTGGGSVDGNNGDSVAMETA